jgi:serine/threonine protein kinase
VQEYRIIEILGAGSFGIVYKAENKYFSEIVALKEFLPIELAYRPEGDSRIRPLTSENENAYKWARSKFLQEAKTLRELGTGGRHPNIVHVRQFIEANDTAYMVMDFEEGRPLSELLEENGILMEQELKSILYGLLDELSRVHEASVLHRDIKPSNILIRSDGSPVLIDFGAARKDVTGSDRSTIVVFSPAYAAVEQVCPIGTQGPWTDIYGLGATLYRAITGNTPATASERLEGKAYVSITEAAIIKYPPSFFAAVDAALKLYPEARPQSISAWKKMFVPQAAVKQEATVLRPVSDPTMINSGEFSSASSGVGSSPKTLTHTPKAVTRTINTRLHLLMVMIVLVIASAVAWWVYWLKDIPGTPLGTMDKTHSDTTVKDKRTESPDRQPDQTKRKTFPVIYDDQSTEKKKTFSMHALLTIQSVPTQARVVLDGKKIGITPIHINIGNGMHSLRLSLKGYHEWESNLLIEDNGEIPIKIPLQKK